MEHLTQTAELGRLIPAFKLPTTRNEVISSWDYKEKKHLVIVFFDLASSNDLMFLAELGRRYGEFKEDEIEILGISNQSVASLSGCVSDLRLPFRLLSDESGEVACAYKADKSRIYIADRFGELQMMEDVTGDTDHLIDVILDKLGLIEIQCDECGVPSWT